MRALVELFERVAELERRVANQYRHGTVEEVDPAKQLVRVRMGEGDDGKPFIGPWVPYAQIAGALKVHTPPSVGQQMTMLNPTGDFRQAVALPLTWSDQNPSPSQNGDEHVLTFGSVKVTLKDKLVEIKVGDAKLTVTDQEIVAEVSGKKIGVKGSRVYSVGPSYFGLDAPDDGAPKVGTEADLAKQTYAKVT